MLTLDPRGMNSGNLDEGWGNSWQGKEHRSSSYRKRIEASLGSSRGSGRRQIREERGEEPWQLLASLALAPRSSATTFRFVARQYNFGSDVQQSFRVVSKRIEAGRLRHSSPNACMICPAETRRRSDHIAFQSAHTNGFSEFACASVVLRENKPIVFGLYLAARRISFRPVDIALMIVDLVRGISQRCTH